MALEPINEEHALQIQAGILGRKQGHKFEDKIAEEINNLQYPLKLDKQLHSHVAIGDPAILLLQYIASTIGVTEFSKVIAISTGALATQESGKKWLKVNGIAIRNCKSDLIITCVFPDKTEATYGISTKQCNNKTPTNAQLYFTTARGFSNLLNQNGISVSDTAIKAMRQFCGDKEFRPLDTPNLFVNRQSDPRRFFWEEIDAIGRKEWEKTFSEKQTEITNLLLKKAYADDKFPPDFILHKTKKVVSGLWEDTEVAIYHIDELLKHSADYSGFALKPYRVNKGTYKETADITHYAPRFGIVQMQRGGQKQHPEQLQFNLQAGYFYKISQERSDVSG